MNNDRPGFNPAGAIMISYRHADGEEIARSLAWKLWSAGIPVWLDQHNLPPGDIENRLRQTISNGLSGCIFIATETIGTSRIVREIEAPRLLQTYQENEEFAICIVNTIKTNSGDLDFDAPGAQLGQSSLRSISQFGHDDASLLELVGKLQRHRLDQLSSEVLADNNTVTVSLQTREPPQVNRHNRGQLDVRIQPTEARLPSWSGLHDLSQTIKHLPMTIAQSPARRIRITGGAHLSVAFALGAALPETHGYEMEVMHRGEPWHSSHTAHSEDRAEVAIKSRDTGKRNLRSNSSIAAVYVNLVDKEGKDTFPRFTQEHSHDITEWLWLVPSEGTRGKSDQLEPSKAGLIATEVISYIRAFSAQHPNAELHLFLHCTFPIAVLLGRLTNTLRCVLHEWHAPGYVPALRVEASRGAGVITDVLLPESTGHT